MADSKQFYVVSPTRKYLKSRQRGVATGKKYAWGSHRNSVVIFETREKARSVARRYGGNVVVA
jgi:hypothetical protein